MSDAPVQWGPAAKGTKLHAVNPAKARFESFCGKSMTYAESWAAPDDAPEGACAACVRAAKKA